MEAPRGWILLDRVLPSSASEKPVIGQELEVIRGSLPA